MRKKITFLTLFLWLMTVTFPVIAQQKADTTYTFRFVNPEKPDVPLNKNDAFQKVQKRHVQEKR